MSAVVRRGLRAALLPASLVGMFLLVAMLSAAGTDEAWKAPLRAARRKNPIPADEKSIAIGKEGYTKNCLVCHGPLGKGDGKDAPTLERPPGNLSLPKMWEQTDGELFWKITEGKKPMPAHEKLLTEEQRWMVVDYIRTLAPKPGSATAQPTSSQPVSTTPAAN